MRGCKRRCVQVCGWGVQAYVCEGVSVWVGFMRRCVRMWGRGGACVHETLWVLVCGSVLGLWVSGSVYIVHANAQSIRHKTSHMHTRLLTRTHIYIRSYSCTCKHSHKHTHDHATTGILGRSCPFRWYVVQLWSVYIHIYVHILHMQTLTQAHSRPCHNGCTEGDPALFTDMLFNCGLWPIPNQPTMCRVQGYNTELGKLTKKFELVQLLKCSSYVRSIHTQVGRSFKFVIHTYLFTVHGCLDLPCSYTCIWQ